jgi:hypothetical protein
MSDETDPFMAFDWYFSDASLEESARSHTLLQKPRETQTLILLLNADSVVSFALWSTLPEDHPVAALWLETNTDLLATVYLAYGGFYRQALTVLRAWFEIAVLGVFFSGHHGQPTGRYEQWRQGTRHAPVRMDRIAASLAARDDRTVDVQEGAFLSVLQPVHSFLSAQVHAQGLDVWDLQRGRDNVPRFLLRSYDIWYSEVFNAFNAICFLYRVFFPSAIANYLAGSDSERDALRRLDGSLSALMPEFGALVEQVLTLTGPSE